MAKVSWSLDAINDLKEINDYISLDSVYYATRIIDKIFTKTDLLETHILAGRVVPEFADEKIRELLENPYRIVYKIEGDNEISIVHVYHSARRIRL